MKGPVDVLVVGGGLAGMYAALKAHEAGARVLLVSKGPIGRSGGSIFAGVLVGMAPKRLRAEESTARSADASVPSRTQLSSWYYYYLMDEGHLRRANEFVAEELWAELERIGYYIRRAPDGRFVSRQGPQGTWTPQFTPSMGMSGRAMGDVIRRRVFDVGIPVLEETMATSLLVNDGRCVGATVLDIAQGRFVPILAKTTILATGHANFLSKRSTATREVCGDGIAIPYRAGAELFNLEIQEFHVSDMAWPPAWTRLHIYPNPLPATAETSKLVMGDGTVLFEGKKASALSAPYYYQLKRLYEYAKRTGQPLESFKRGGYFSDLRHVDPALLDEYSYQTQFIRKLGLDPAKDLVENAPTYHYTRGGVWADMQTMESLSLPGLFAAGGAAGRLGQTICMYDGKRAADAAVHGLSSTKAPRIDRTWIAREEARVLEPLRRTGDGGIPPARIKDRIRDVMWTKMDYVKSEPKMRSALSELQAIRSDMVPAMRLASSTRRYNYEWIDALDVTNMLDACELQIRASLERKESRGPFFREDHPYHDNENWLKYLVVRPGEAGPEMRTEPVGTDGLSLPEREDFFATNY